jgi:hypothetical protein
MDLIRKFLYIVAFFAILNYFIISGIPITDKSKGSSTEGKEIKNDVEHLSETEAISVVNDNSGLFGGVGSEVQADVAGLEDPTARIIVTVMKRSRRFWEPWELNYSMNV